ncbi:MAG TPA: hypothetical protein VL093_13565 [Flavipsychrobacter sp.]|nr:hypothetical protein [Flavipsychrobacter sp.]
MKVIGRPLITLKQVFDACVNDIAEGDKKQSFIDCYDVLADAEAFFNGKVISQEVYQIETAKSILGSIGKEEMVWLYEYKMVQRNGRDYYDYIRASAPFGKCPLCSVREVETLDHYLPKTQFPALAITPINLVPSCSPCNTGKKIKYPRTTAEQTLHPYYDDIEKDNWLSAHLIKTDPIGFHFFVNAPEAWDHVKADRVKNHFESYGLDELFSAKANEELRGSQSYHQALFNHSSELLKFHLEESGKSRALNLGVNSWQAVMYKTLASDEWFLSEGVLI